MNQLEAALINLRGLVNDGNPHYVRDLDIVEDALNGIEICGYVTEGRVCTLRPHKLSEHPHGRPGLGWGSWNGAGR